MIARSDFKSPDDYISIFVSWLSKRVRYIGTDTGKHSFEGGVLSALGSPSLEGSMVLLSFSFRDATLKFLDELFVVATNEYATCTMHISTTFGGDMVRIKEFLKGNSKDFFETTGGNFSGSLSLSGQMIRVNVYPSVNRLTLECTLNRWSGSPSELIRSFLEGKKPKYRFRKLFGR